MAFANFKSFPNRMSDTLDKLNEELNRKFGIRPKFDPAEIIRMESHLNNSRRATRPTPPPRPQQYNPQNHLVHGNQESTIGLNSEDHWKFPARPKLELSKPIGRSETKKSVRPVSMIASMPTPKTAKPPEEKVPLENRHHRETPRISECLECRDFRAVDYHASNFPRQGVKSVKALAAQLTAPFPSRTDRARAIFIWLHHNVAYDTVAFFANNMKHKTPEQTMRSGLAVCQGYAELFEALGKYGGLDVQVVSGHGKGYGYSATERNPNRSNHAWNAVRFDDNQWHLIDSCWGAGHTDNNRTYQHKLATEHFTSTAEVFRRRHYPTNPKLQFCEDEMSWNEYLNLPEGPLIYTELNEMEFREDSIQPSVRRIPKMPTKFVIRRKCECSPVLPKDQYVLLLRIGKNHTPFQVNAEGTVWSCEIRGIHGVDEISVDKLAEFHHKDGKGVTIQEYLKGVGRVSMVFKGICKWDVI